MCASTRKMMLRSTDHVCKCKERYHPPPHPIPWCCVAPTMCASAKNVIIPHPTPPPPHPTMWIPGKPPVPRVVCHLCFPVLPACRDNFDLCVLHRRMPTVWLPSPKSLGDFHVGLSRSKKRSRLSISMWKRHWRHRHQAMHCSSQPSLWHNCHRPRCEEARFLEPTAFLSLGGFRGPARFPRLACRQYHTWRE